MANYKELANFVPAPPERQRVTMDEKITQSLDLVRQWADPDIHSEITVENLRLGVIPRLSEYDVMKLPVDARLVRVPHELKEKLKTERSHDLIRWNKPRRFLDRLKIAQTPFARPAPGESRVMDRLEAERRVVGFDNLRINPPPPENSRQSRTEVNNKLELNIMGQARIPFALGSVPDVGSFLAYVTMAQANGMVFVSRDKILSDFDQQATLVKDIINHLKRVNLPKEIEPNEEELLEFAQIMKLTEKPLTTDQLRKIYFSELRNSWIANVGIAIEASDEGIKRAEYVRKKTGVRLVRIYSPEGGIEIVDTTKKLGEKSKGRKPYIKVAGQVMDEKTAIRAEEAGANGLFNGVAGGAQCTTSVEADISVNTPNLLYEERGKIGIPIGVEGGGVGTHVMTALELGASFLSKPGEIGASWEGSGGEFMFRDSQGKYYMIYSGEASRSAKWWKDSVDDLERPKFVEGETGIREITPERMSMTGNIKKLRDRLSNGLVFQRLKSIPELHNRDCDNVVEVTAEADALSKAYGQ